MNRAEIKAEAKNELRGNWIWAVWVGLVSSLIYAILFGRDFKIAISGASKGDFTVLAENGFWAGQLAGNSIKSLLAGFFMLSVLITFLNLARGRRLPFFKAIFAVFTDNRFVPEFLNYLLASIFALLWSILLIIPGIVKGYSYALAPYIVNDMVESGRAVHATTGINESRRLMQGHKWELFVLNLSFIGWHLLAIITMGIGYIWLIPYIQTTKANFYRKLAGDQFKQE